MARVLGLDAALDVAPCLVASVLSPCRNLTSRGRRETHLQALNEGFGGGGGGGRQVLLREGHAFDAHNHRVPCGGQHQQDNIRAARTCDDLYAVSGLGVLGGLGLGSSTGRTCDNRGLRRLWAGGGVPWRLSSGWALKPTPLCSTLLAPLVRLCRCCKWTRGWWCPLPACRGRGTAWRARGSRSSRCVCGCLRKGHGTWGEGQGEPAGTRLTLVKVRVWVLEERAWDVGRGARGTSRHAPHARQGACVGA